MKFGKSIREAELRSSTRYRGCYFGYKALKKLLAFPDALRPSLILGLDVATDAHSHLLRELHTEIGKVETLIHSQLYKVRARSRATRYRGGSRVLHGRMQWSVASAERAIMASVVHSWHGGRRVRRAWSWWESRSWLRREASPPPRSRCSCWRRSPPRRTRFALLLKALIEPAETRNPNAPPRHTWAAAVVPGGDRDGHIPARQPRSRDQDRQEGSD
jgi:hypothetical protein